MYGQPNSQVCNSMPPLPQLDNVSNTKAKSMASSAETVNRQLDTLQANIDALYQCLSPCLLPEVETPASPTTNKQAISPLREYIDTCGDRLFSMNKTLQNLINRIDL